MPIVYGRFKGIQARDFYFLPFKSFLLFLKYTTSP